MALPMVETTMMMSNVQKADIGTSLPEESPLEMPRHKVQEERQPAKKLSNQPLISIFLARLFVFCVTAYLSWYGATEMFAVLNTNSIAGMQWAFLVLFCINFTWISFAFSQATLGFFSQINPFRRKIKEAEPETVTAILLPVYNEDPVRIRASIEAMHSDLVEKAPGKFAFFILSDSNKANSAVKEKQTFYPILNNDTDKCPVYYRRRYNNAERKAGNIADWVTRFGGAYESMIVLDADSLMSADCLITLSRRMAAEPGMGLIQTLPTIIEANTLYSRLQQFANQCFGPIYAAGLSAWHGSASNFWGHNAIIRTKAFASACGLPILSGKPPFGGHVMSHDFMEAAMLRRAGWGVRFDNDLQASHEEAPPSLIDVMVRDRRWCQGNLQHKAFLLAKGFHFATRLHIISGIFAYLSAVFWFLLIAVGFALALQAHFVRPEYFANPSLFPTWPVFDFEKARLLFEISMALILAPKIFGWLSAMVNLRRCREFGGPIFLTINSLLEIVLSAMYAPILMFSQFLVVFDVLKGRDSGWSAQSRDDGATPLKTVCRAHLSHTLLGAGLASSTLYLSPQLFYWSLPISFGLTFSIPLSWLSGGAKRGNLLSTIGFLKSSQEKRPTPIVKRLHDAQQQLNRIDTQDDLSALHRMTQDEHFYRWHLAQMPEEDLASLSRPRICAEWQIKMNDNLDDLVKNIKEEECLAILKSRSLMEAMGKFLPNKAA